MTLGSTPGRRVVADFDAGLALPCAAGGICVRAGAMLDVKRWLLADGSRPSFALTP